MFPIHNKMDEFDPRDTFDGGKDDFQQDGLETNQLSGYKGYDLDANGNEKHPTMIEICRVQNEAKLNFKPPTDQTEKLYLDATARKAKQQTNAKESRGDQETVYSFQPELTDKSKQLMVKANKGDHLSRTAQWQDIANAKKEEQKVLKAQKNEEEHLQATRPVSTGINKVTGQSKVKAGINAMEEKAQAKVARVAQKEPNFTSEMEAEGVNGSPRDLRKNYNDRKKDVLGFLHNISPGKYQIPVGKHYDAEFEKTKVIPVKIQK